MFEVMADDLTLSYSMWFQPLIRHLRVLPSTKCFLQALVNQFNYLTGIPTEQ